MKRIPLVDALRSLSILAVLATHLGCQYIVNPSPWRFLQVVWYKIWINGAFGVTMFFVVSGFVITRLIAQQPQGLYQPDFRDFYSRRAGRLLPLLVVACLLGQLILALPHTPSHAFNYCFQDPQAGLTPGFWLSIATFSFYWYQKFMKVFEGVGVHWGLLWSLSVEEQFYFLYPWLLKILKRGTNLSAWLYTVVFFQPVFDTAHHFLFPQHDIPVLDSIGPFGSVATGCLLYLKAGQYGPLLSRNKKRSFWILLFGLAVFLKAYLHQDYKADVWGHILGFPLINIGLFFFLLGALHLDFFKSKFWSLVGFPGQLSYGMYLLHIVVLFFLFPLLTGMNDFLAFFFYAAVTTLLAWGSYHFYEVPANLWIRKLLGRHY